MRRTSLYVALVPVLVGIGSCTTSPSEPTEPEQPTEQRVLGLVAGIEWAVDGGENPRAWIVDGRRIKVRITTIGSCEVTRTDWYTRARDAFLGDEGFLFILPYEYRSTQCPSGPYRTLDTVPFTDTLDFEFDTALEATVRVVGGDGSVFDMHVDFHPGWPN